MNLTHVDGLVDRLATASAVAWMLAYAASRGRKWIIENDREECFLQAAFLEQLQEARNVHVEGAAVLTGRKRQLLADSCGATVAHNVIFEFIAEVAKRSQHGIGRRLAESAERAIADVAA